MIGPAVRDWPPETIAWCQACDRPIRHGQPYRTVDLTGSSLRGFTHRTCLRLVK